MSGIIYSLYGIHSAFSIIAYITFRPDFRERFLYMVGTKPSNEVVIGTQVKSSTSTHPSWIRW